MSTIPGGGYLRHDLIRTDNQTRAVQRYPAALEKILKTLEVKKIGRDELSSLNASNLGLVVDDLSFEEECWDLVRKIFMKRKTREFYKKIPDEDKDRDETEEICGL